MSQVDAASGTKTRTEPISGDGQGTGVKDADRGSLRDAAANKVGATEQAAATGKVGDQPGSPDSFEARAPQPDPNGSALKANNQKTNPDAPPIPQQKPDHLNKNKVPLPRRPPPEMRGFKDGAFVNDPTKLTDDQARHLKALSNDKNLPQSTRDDIKSFLRDRDAGVDSLFPKGNSGFTKEQWDRFRKGNNNPTIPRQL